MQSRREVVVFEAVSSSNVFPDVVSNIITDYVLGKEADEIINMAHLHINLHSRMTFVALEVAIWQHDKRRIAQMIHENNVVYHRYKFEFIMKPWLMLHYRCYVADAIEIIKNLLNEEIRLNDYIERRIPLEYVPDESDM
jgi:hypothetical protein